MQCDNESKPGGRIDAVLLACLVRAINRWDGLMFLPQYSTGTLYTSLFRQAAAQANKKGKSIVSTQYQLN